MQLKLVLRGDEFLFEGQPTEASLAFALAERWLTAATAQDPALTVELEKLKQETAAQRAAVASQS